MSKGKLIVEDVLTGIKTMREIEHRTLVDIVALKKPHTQAILTKETKEHLKNEQDKIERGIEILDEVITRVEIIVEELKNEK